METEASLIDTHYSDLQTTFHSGHTRSLAWRKCQLKNLLRGCKAMEKEITHALSIDVGKPEPASILELGAAVQEIKFAYSNVECWMQKEYVRSNIDFQPGTSSWRQPQPLGVALIMSAWNFPFALLIQPLVGAIAAGCCAVLKPSEISPNTALIAEKLVGSFLDPAAYRVVVGGVGVSSRLVQRFRWDKIFFTGGSKTGRIIAQAAAKTLTSVTLELGGKNPTIVDKHVDLKVAVSRILWCKLENAGQFCMSVDYCIIHEDIVSSFMKEFKNLYRYYWGDNPGHPETVVKMAGRIVNEQHWERLHKMISEIEVSNSESILVGGTEYSSRSRRYIPLTVVLNPPMKSMLMSEEIFGPILPIFTVPSISQAITFVNSMPSKYPLALYVFSNNIDIAQQVIDETMSGNATINDCALNLLSPYLPFGGVGDSGVGNYHGKFTFDSFSHFKSIMSRTTLVDPIFGYVRHFRKDMNIENFARLRRIYYLSFGVRDSYLVEVLFLKAIKVAIIAIMIESLAKFANTKC